MFVAAGIALGLHALLLVALPAVPILTPAHVGQNPGVTSLEIALAQPAPKPPRPSAPEPEPEKPVVEPESEPEPGPEPLPAIVPEPPPPVPAPEPAAPSPQPQAPSESSSGALAAAVSHHNIRYPERAVVEGRSGAPIVRVEVLASGRAGRVELIESSGYADLDRAAVNGLRTAWYRPATAGRRPVVSTKLFRPRFVIENGRAKIR